MITTKTIDDFMSNIWNIKNHNPNTIASNCEILSRKIFTNTKIKIGGGFAYIMESINNISEIDNQEKFYDTIDAKQRYCIFRYSGEDGRIIDRFFRYITVMKMDHEYEEMKLFVKAMAIFIQKLYEVYNNEFNKKEEEKEMANTNNENYVTETELKSVVQDVATSVELGAMMVQCEALTSLDEDNQKKFVKALCELSASNADALMPDYSDDMRSSYYLAVSCINDLIGTNNDLFGKTLAEALDAMNKSEYADDTDRKAVSFVYDYIKGKDVEHAKAMLKVIKLYLSTVYEFIKNFAEQH